MDLGAGLRALRRQRGLTQDGLADLAGVSRNTVSEIERGASPGTVRIVTKLATALGVPAAELLVGATPVAEQATA